MAQAAVMLIAGEWQSSKSAFPVLDKFTGAVMGEVPVATAEDVARATAAARAAFPAYSALPAHARSRILRKAAEIMERRQEELATLICREAGKAWKYSSGEVSRAI